MHRLPRISKISATDLRNLYDLELTRMVSIQTAPQIRMIQNSDSVMAEKIQSTLVNTIPLWKNQMIIALAFITRLRLPKHSARFRI